MVGAAAAGVGSSSVECRGLDSGGSNGIGLRGQRWHCSFGLLAWRCSQLQVLYRRRVEAG